MSADKSASDKSPSETNPAPAPESAAEPVTDVGPVNANGQAELPQPPMQHKPRKRLPGSGEHPVLFTLVLAVVLGALVHIAVIFAIPLLGTSDAVSRLTAAAGGGVIVLEEGGTLPPQSDPSFVVAACAFDLAQGPFTVSATVPDHYAGLSLHRPGGGVLYAVTEEVATARRLSLAVMTQKQANDIDTQALSMQVSRDDDVRAVVPVTKGVAVYRVFVPLPSQREAMRTMALTLRCQPVSSN